MNPRLARAAIILFALTCAAAAADLSRGGDGGAASRPGSDPVVINTLKGSMTARNRPSWCGVTGAAVLKGMNSGHFDRHYHDCNEYWMICKGKAKIRVNGKTYYVHDGDIVCTKAGEEHDVLELYEPIVGYYLEDATPPGGRTGHLHKTEADARGHAVPLLPVPADFPVDRE